MGCVRSSCLNLALLVRIQNNGLIRTGEWTPPRCSRTFEPRYPVWLELVPLPNAQHGYQADLLSRRYGARSSESHLWRRSSWWLPLSPLPFPRRSASVVRLRVWSLKIPGKPDCRNPFATVAVSVRTYQACARERDLRFHLRRPE